MKNPNPGRTEEGCPQTTWGKLFLGHARLMTVIRHVARRLASSEMTRAQYDRASPPAPSPKPATSGVIFSSQKLRSAIQHTRFDLLQATTELPRARRRGTAKKRQWRSTPRLWLPPFSSDRRINPADVGRQSESRSKQWKLPTRNRNHRTSEQVETSALAAALLAARKKRARV